MPFQRFNKDRRGSFSLWAPLSQGQYANNLQNRNIFISFPTPMCTGYIYSNRKKSVKIELVTYTGQDNLTINNLSMGSFD